MSAKFDEFDHCTEAGYATHQRRRSMGRFRVRCALGRHRLPSEPPTVPNGHSPSNYDKCFRCGAHVKWYVVGQHRWGGYDRDTAIAYDMRPV